MSPASAVSAHRVFVGHAGLIWVVELHAPLTVDVLAFWHRDVCTVVGMVDLLGRPVELLGWHGPLILSVQRVESSA